METSVNPKHFLDLEVGDVIAYPSGEVVGVIMPIQEGIGRFRRENQLVNGQQTCKVGFITKPTYIFFQFHAFPADLEELCRVEKGLRPDLTQFKGDCVSSIVFPGFQKAPELYNDFDFETDICGNILEISFWLRIDNVQLCLDKVATPKFFNSIKSLTEFATIGILS